MNKNPSNNRPQGNRPQGNRPQQGNRSQPSPNRAQQSNQSRNQTTPTKSQPGTPNKTQAAKSNTLHIPLDLNEICDGNMLKLITAHAANLGVPREYFLFPVLSCVAGLLNGSVVVVNESWSEKCALWFAVAGRQGTRKSAVVERLSSSVLAADAIHQRQATAGRRYEASPQNGILLDYITPEQLDTFSRGPLSRLGLYEELADFFEMLDLNTKPRQRIQMKRLYDFSTHHKATLNCAGFVKQNDMKKFLAKDNTQLADRILIAFPHIPDVYTKTFRVPLTFNTPNITEVFSILRSKHGTPIFYRFQAPARVFFMQICDTYTERVNATNDEAVKSILRKCAGQLARLSVVFRALRQALKMVVFKDAPIGLWQPDITPEDIRAARLLLNYCTRIKVALYTGSDALLQKMECPKLVIQPTPVRNDVRLPKPRPPVTNFKGTIEIDDDSGDDDDIKQTEPPAKVFKPNHPRMMSPNVGPPQMRPRGPGTFNNMMPHLNRMPGVPPTTQGYNNGVSTNPQTMQQPPVLQQQPMPPTTTSSGPQQQPMMPINQTNNQRPPEQTPPNGVTQPPQQQSLPQEQGNSIRPPDSAASDSSRDASDTIDFGDIIVQGADGKVLKISSNTNNTDVSTDSWQYEPYSDEELKSLLDEHRPHLRLLLLYNREYRLSPSCVSQQHLMPSVAMEDGQLKYPVSLARQFLWQVCRMGFGTMCSYHHAASRRITYYFQKRKYEDLKPETKEILKTLEVTDEEYNSAFNEPRSGTPSPGTSHTASPQPSDQPSPLMDIDINSSNTPLVDLDLATSQFDFDKTTPDLNLASSQPLVELSNQTLFGDSPTTSLPSTTQTTVVAEVHQPPVTTDEPHYQNL